MIYTFVFMGCEYYCPSCGFKCGEFDVELARSVTKQELKLFKVIQKEWKEVSPHLFCGGGQLGDCKLCREKNEYHANHLTKEEIEKQKWAFAKIEEFKHNNYFINNLTPKVRE
jgi:hypothetical protein